MSHKHSPPTVRMKLARMLALLLSPKGLVLIGGVMLLYLMIVVSHMVRENRQTQASRASENMQSFVQTICLQQRDECSYVGASGLQQAVRDIPLGAQGVLTLEPGIYTHEDSPDATQSALPEQFLLIQDRNVRISASGSGEVVFTQSSGGMRGVSVVNGDVLLENITIRDFVGPTDGPVEQRGYCLSYAGSATGELRNMTLSGCGGVGVQVAGYAHLRVLADSIVQSNGGAGIEGMGGAQIDGIGRNTVRGNAYEGIVLFDNAMVGQIETNAIEENGLHGVAVQSQAAVSSIHQNTIQGNGRSGIALFESGLVRNTIANNTISAHAEKGIALQGSSMANSIQGNEISQNGTGGILLFHSAVVQLIGENQIYENPVRGVGLQDMAYAGSVQQNTVRDAQYGITVAQNAQVGTVAGNTIDAGDIGVYVEPEAYIQSLYDNTVTVPAGSCAVYQGAGPECMESGL